MIIEKIEIIKDKEISYGNNEFFNISVNGEVVLECVGKNELARVIPLLFKDSEYFKKVII